MNAKEQVIGGEICAVPALTGVSAAKSSKFTAQLGQYLLAAALGAAIYASVSRYVIQTVAVVGTSMTPTLVDSQRYLLNRLVYQFHTPQRSDVVVLRDPLDQGFSVKRVVGVSGDLVRIRGGTVAVNGRVLVEEYLASGTATFPSQPVAEREYRCGPDEYFVLGDNRQNSLDSRVYGPVPLRNILGRVVH